MNVIDRIEAEQTNRELPDFKAGDTLRVHAKIVEGDKERIQVFDCLLYTSPSPRDKRQSRMPSSA